jgi:hypothetical protein
MKETALIRTELPIFAKVETLKKWSGREDGDVFGSIPEQNGNVRRAFATEATTLLSFSLSFQNDCHMAAMKRGLPANKVKRIIKSATTPLLLFLKNSKKRISKVGLCCYTQTAQKERRVLFVRLLQKTWKVNSTNA